ncbi:MAG: D-alanyl-D-alanine carboxypeptidase family protein [Pseudomonadota bacterium]
MMRLSPSKSAIAALAVGALSLSGTFLSEAQAERYASIVVDASTDTVLHARHADAPRYPASLTKVMTLYMLFDELEAGRVSASTMMAVSRNAASQPPSNLRLKRGDTISVHDAIHALITKSANDVAVVVAEHIGGTEERFSALMTVKAQSLGMANTRFFNASGLPDTRQISTARDMALLAEAIMEEHAGYYHYFSTREFRWGSRTYRNHNELLGSVDGVDGLKTGYTRASGYNLMASAVRGDTRVITVMLGGRTSRARNAHVAELIEAAYQSFAAPVTPGESLQTHIAFESVRQPIDPDAAAIPTLNGKPFPVGEGDVQ